MPEMTFTIRSSVLLAGVAAAAICAGAARAGEEAALQGVAFGEPVNAAELDRQRGKAAPDCASGCSLGGMTATLTGNTANVGAVTANNVIGNNALANASGAFVAVQNIGNNVIIQTNMDVDVNLVHQ
jgi:hypothetical protein